MPIVYTDVVDQFGRDVVQTFPNDHETTYVVKKDGINSFTLTVSNDTPLFLVLITINAHAPSE